MPAKPPIANAQPRESQKQILKYSRGKMGVAAVPGSGKTWTLSLLAATLVREVPLKRDQQILVVTLVNAARGSFEQRMRDFLGDDGLGVGYRVRTLHGLAKDIVSERPDLAGLNENFQIIDERDSAAIIGDSVRAWTSAHPDMIYDYVQTKHVNTPSVKNNWVEELNKMALAFIKGAKDRELEPEPLRNLRGASFQPLPLLDLCLDVYELYERGLRYRGAIDFQDLIRLALKALRAEPNFAARLRRRWLYILEDEAQDSSKLQEEILRLLVGENGNWVRVGDPNQAIYETFTTANPKYLRDFLREQDVIARELPESGRSAPSIIRLANQLIDWALSHPNETIRLRTPLTDPKIKPLKSGNPPDSPEAVQLIATAYTPEQERDAALEMLRVWLPKHPDQTAALLLPSNYAGTKMVDLLRKANIPYIERLNTTTPTRKVAGSLAYIINFLAEATHARALADIYQVWKRDERDETLIKQIKAALSEIRYSEAFTAPRDLAQDWLWNTVSQDDQPEIYQHLLDFRAVINRWEKAALLPIDQLILTISGDIFTDPPDTATAYALAIYMRQYAQAHPREQLKDYANELKQIALNLRKFSGVSDDDRQFNPDEYKGQVTVMTLHGAKGLEWDRVHVMAVNNYDFPSADDFDEFIGEPYYMRDRLNLQAEVLAQLDALLLDISYIEGAATREARFDYAAERLRLLYVGITRARRELVITWNSGSTNSPVRKVEAKPIPALRAWWEEARAR